MRLSTNSNVVQHNPTLLYSTGTTPPITSTATIYTAYNFLGLLGTLHRPTWIHTTCTFDEQRKCSNVLESQPKPGWLLPANKLPAG